MTTYIMADRTPQNKELMCFILRTIQYHTASAPYKKIEHRGVVHTESEIFKNDIFCKGVQIGLRVW